MIDCMDKNFSAPIYTYAASKSAGGHTIVMEILKKCALINVYSLPLFLRRRVLCTNLSFIAYFISGSVFCSVYIQLK